MAASTTDTVAVVEPLLLKVDEAARVLSIGRDAMWHLVMSGEVASVRIGRSRRVPTAALREWVRQQEATA